MISHKSFATSTKNVFAFTTSLLCATDAHSMLLVRQQYTKPKQIRTILYQKRDALYQHVAAIGDTGCSSAHITGKCLSPICCKDIYSAPNTYSLEKWSTAENINKKRRADILENIDTQSATRIAFVKKTNKEIECLSAILKQAHWQYLYNGNIREYKEVYALIDRKHHCLLNLLRVIEQDTDNYWKKCKSLTVQELRNPDNREQIVDLLALCAEESVESKSVNILEDQLQRDKVIAQHWPYTHDSTNE